MTDHHTPRTLANSKSIAKELKHVQEQETLSFSNRLDQLLDRILVTDKKSQWNIGFLCSVLWVSALLILREFISRD
jgi:hypothetical protein